MDKEKALISLKAAATFGGVAFAFFVLSHLLGGHPHQPSWSVPEAARGLFICLVVSVVSWMVNYSYQFHSSPDQVRSVDFAAFVVVGLIAWGGLSVWHFLILIHRGWPGLDANTSLVVPWIALAVQPLLFRLKKWGRASWGLLFAALSVSAALMFAMVEINDLMLVR